MVELIFWIIGLSSVWILSKVIPAERRFLQQWLYDAMDDVTSFEKKDNADTVDTQDCIKVILRMYVFNKLKAACTGFEAPNPMLLTLGGKDKKLFDLQKKSRPLVVNFGNCT